MCLALGEDFDDSVNRLAAVLDAVFPTVSQREKDFAK